MMAKKVSRTSVVQMDLVLGSRNRAPNHQNIISRAEKNTDDFCSYFQLSARICSVYNASRMFLEKCATGLTNQISEGFAALFAICKTTDNFQTDDFA